MTNIRTTAAAFATVVGISMLGMWLVFLITRQVPEWDSKPVETSLHITAEVLTAFALIAAGAGLFLRQIWAKDIYLFSMGMLLYSVIQASGYFAQQGRFTYLSMFAVFAMLAVIFTILILFEPDDMRSPRQIRRSRVG